MPGGTTGMVAVLPPLMTCAARARWRGGDAGSSMQAGAHGAAARQRRARAHAGKLLLNDLAVPGQASHAPLVARCVTLDTGPAVESLRASCIRGAPSGGVSPEHSRDRGSRNMSGTAIATRTCRCLPERHHGASIAVQLSCPSRHLAPDHVAELASSAARSLVRGSLACALISPLTKPFAVRV